jgi:hypothetical protein
MMICATGCPKLLDLIHPPLSYLDFSEKSSLSEHFLPAHVHRFYKRCRLGDLSMVEQELA